MFFKQLDSEEERSFRQWARDNYKPFTKIDGIWHPVSQDECVKMNVENSSLALPAVLHTCETFNPDTCAACRVIQRSID
jgi:hypothetical protein